MTLPETIGYATSIAFGVLVWPMALLYVGENLAPEYETTRGVGLALILWIVLFVVLFPVSDACQSSFRSSGRFPG